MQVHGYIQLREALDRAAEVFGQYASQLSADDIQLKREIEMIRMKVVRSETGTPFASATPAPSASAPKPSSPAPVAPAVAAAPVLPPDLTKAPWSR